MGTFKVIPKEVKEQILNRIKNEGVSVAKASTDHGVSVKTIYTWLKAGSTPSVNFLEYARLKRENKLLLGLVGKLSLEREQVASFKKN